VSLFGLLLVAVDDVDEYEVQQTEGGYARPSVTSCWLESKTDDVSRSHRDSRSLTPQTFEIKYEIQGETMRKHSPFDWSVHISVDGRTIKRSVLSYLTTGPSVHTVSSMNFMEYGVAYNGKLYFAPLVSLIALRTWSMLRGSKPPIAMRKSPFGAIDCSLWAKFVLISCGEPWVRRWNTLQLDAS
jgi:hypothetical protein